MKKEIYFCLDSESYYSFKVHASCKSMFFITTRQKIEQGADVIVTTSLYHLSFNMLRRGYDVFLCYKDKQVKITEGMELDDGCYLEEPTCCEDSDILDYFYNGYFNELLGLKLD